MTIKQELTEKISGLLVYLFDSNWFFLDDLPEPCLLEGLVELDGEVLSSVDFPTLDELSTVLALLPGKGVKSLFATVETSIKRK